jgi:glutathione S-transferase
MATPQPLTLVSHALCPYVQRAAIVLAEKGMAFERRDVDLSNKPEWFLEVSPLGKTPVLLVGGEPIFESAVICEYLDETVAPALHPSDPLQRARDRGWMEFGSAMLNTIGSFYNAAGDATLLSKARDLRSRFVQLEAVLGQGPYFDGQRFGMVDAVFGPVFRYFDVFERIDDFGFFTDLPKVMRWRDALSNRPSVRDAARRDYPQRLRAFLLARGSALSRRMAAIAQPCLAT